MLIVSLEVALVKRAVTSKETSIISSIGKAQSSSANSNASVIVYSFAASNSILVFFLFLFLKSFSQVKGVTSSG